MSARALLIGLFALAACGAEPAPVTPTPVEAQSASKPDMFADVLAQHQELNRRVEAVTYRLLTANAEFCSERRRSAGLSAHTLRDYPQGLRTLARHMLGVDEGMSVRSVVADGPAGEAGIQAGDAIRRVGDMPIAKSVVAGRVWKIAQAREMQAPHVTLGLERAGERLSIGLETVEACDTEVSIIFSELPNAHTDGQDLYITSELVRRTDDDSRLALILAHELAHVLLHTEDFVKSPALELEADRAGLILMTRAGYDMAAAIAEMDRFGRTLIPGESGTHPAHSARLAALKRQQAEIEGRQARGEPLTLNLGLD